MFKILLDNVTATNATRQEFFLLRENFGGDPTIKTTGLSVGDEVTVWEFVNGFWEESGIILDSVNKSTTINALGTYAVTIVMTSAGPASVVVEASGRL